jgi:Copper type II ascorbate-dependent monooxygenase, C-terminal domain
MKMKFMLLGILLAVLFFTGCEKAETENNTNPTITSYERIQNQILTVSCAISGCHSSPNDATYAQHGLVLANGVSFGNLVGKSPKNAAALADKLQLIKPFEAESSLLYHKIECAANHHTSNYGNQMPMGGLLLTKGQVEFIKRWINNGAKLSDVSVDTSLLKDTTVCLPDITPLPAPAANEGFQLTIDPFDVPKYFEREVFVRKNTPNTQDVFVNRLQMRGRSNSHHFVVYGFRSSGSLLLPKVNEMRDLRFTNGTLNFTTLSEMQNHIFFGGGTDVNTDVTLPDGVALQFAPNTPLDLNAHYFNRSSYVLKGENYVNFYTIPASSVKYIANTLDLNNTDIALAPNERKTFIKTFKFNTITRVVMLTSHFHKLGEKFVIKIAGGSRNGEIVYINTDWEHPAVISFKNPIVLNPGEGLTSEVTYNNTSSKSISFGLTSEDEMNIIFGYYY